MNNCYTKMKLVDYLSIRPTNYEYFLQRTQYKYSLFIHFLEFIEANLSISILINCSYHLVNFLICDRNRQILHDEPYLFSRDAAGAFRVKSRQTISFQITDIDKNLRKHSLVSFSLFSVSLICLVIKV